MAYALENVEPTDIDSVDDIDTARLEHGSLRLEKGPDVPPPTEWDLGLQETVLSFDTGDFRLYRDTEGTGTVEVRDGGDHYLVRTVEPGSGTEAPPTSAPTAEPEHGPSRRRLLLLVLVAVLALAVLYRARARLT